MAHQTYKVKLSGKSQLHEPEVKIEDISINLWSIDGGETWENKNCEVDVNGALQVQMSCKAITGTGWEFVVTNKTTNNDVVKDSGNTGDSGTPNFSNKNYSVNP